MSGEKCPFSFSPLPNNDSIKRDFLGYTHGLSKSQPGDWVLGGRYGEDHADAIYGMDIRDTDVWVVSYPKSGVSDSANGTLKSYI